ncbi:MAG: YjdF family protein, partial [Lachnospiraceae bacterium]|nr:YjdF family protein [Lachnospiraceae bacterium]
MDKVSGKLTVFFEDPFWVGIFERIEDGRLSVAKVTFGAEPKDYEVQQALKLQQEQNKHERKERSREKKE